MQPYSSSNLRNIITQNSLIWKRKVFKGQHCFFFHHSVHLLSLNNNNFNITRSLGASFCLKLILISCWKIVWRPWNKNAILIQSLWCFGYICHCHLVKKKLYLKIAQKAIGHQCSSEPNFVIKLFHYNLRETNSDQPL